MVEQAAHTRHAAGSIPASAMTSTVSRVDDQRMQRVMAFIIRYLYAAGSCGYLFTVGWLFAKHRPLLSAIGAHFGYATSTHRAMLPTLALSAVAPEQTAIQLREPIAVDGNVSALELMVIAKLIRHHLPRQLFEIGTFDGRTTLNMAANAPEGATVYTLDLPRGHTGVTRYPLDPSERVYVEPPPVGLRYTGTDVEHQITPLFGDSATFDFSPFVNRVDFVFVDGSHAYDYVLSDSRRARQLLREGRGVILWHDYAIWDGVTRALNELYMEAREFQDLKHIEGTSLVCLIAT